MPESFYIEPRSGARYPLDVPRWCSDERTPLLISPHRGLSREDINRNMRSLWRYRASLPVEIVNPITMGEGCTPVVQKPWGDFRPYFKLEWFNPTSSFKDRGTTVMLSFLRQIGVDAVLEDSSGNGGASVSAYGAAGGMRVKILAPAFTSPAKVAQMRAHGAEVQLVEGPREESEAEAIRQSERIFYSSHNWQPFFLEGTKSIAYELWEEFDFKAPDNVIVPVGAGSSLLGCYIGFKELMSAGQIKKLPRLFAAQPRNCSPVDASFKAGLDTPVTREMFKTIAEGTAIRHPLRLRENRDLERNGRGDRCRSGTRDHQRPEAARPYRLVRRADLGHGCGGTRQPDPARRHQGQRADRYSRDRNRHQNRVCHR
jgi:threonine synthase